MICPLPAVIERSVYVLVAACGMSDKVVQSIPVVRTVRGTILDTILGPADDFEYESRTSATRS